MKKLLFAAAAAFALAAGAAPEKAATVQIADMQNLVKGVSKLGAMTGNAMFGAMWASALTQNEFVQFFGVPRSDAPFLLVAYIDGEPKIESKEDVADAVKPAFLYPTTRTKEAFLAAHAEDGASETNGVISIDNSYFVFSPDAKWIAASDNADIARLALSEIATAEKPLDGKLVKADITKRAFNLIDSLITSAAARDEKNAAKFNSIAQVLRCYDDLKGSVAVTDSGIDFAAVSAAAKDAPIKDFGSVALGAEPLAFAGADALAAFASAPKGSFENGDSKEQFDLVSSVVKTNGFDMSWIDYKDDGTALKVVLDIAALATYVSNNSEKIQQIDGEKLQADLAALDDKMQNPVTIVDKARTATVEIKGAGVSPSIQQRFAKMMPEAAAKKPYWVCYGSIYGVVRAVFGAALPACTAIPNDQKESLKMVAAMLPPATSGGIADITWRNADGSHEGILRISAEEVKSLGMAANVALMQVLSAANSAPVIIDCDDDDDTMIEIDED